MSFPLITFKFNHGKPPVCADQDSAWLPLESLSDFVDDPLRGVKLKLRVLGFTPGGLGVAVGLDGTGVSDGAGVAGFDGTGVSDGAGVADGFDAGNGDDFSVGVNGDADFEVGDSEDEVNEVVLLLALFDAPEDSREGNATIVAIITAHMTAAINHLH